ncbi:radical SAM protein [bacterium]|nr:radical SAM protein [bacterium]
MPDETFVYYIEVAGVCNLRCPSCPNGNSPKQLRNPMYMSIEMYSEILQKIIKEKPAEKILIYLLNWGEPTLHPELPRLITLANEVGLSPHLSSNLAAPKNLEAMVKAYPASLRISLSGYWPQTYQITHAGGDIEQVRENAMKVARYREKHDARFPVQICYHKYTHNMEGDYIRMQAMAHELNFEFVPLWAFYAPLEKYLSAVEGPFDPGEQALLDLLLIKPHEAQAVALPYRKLYPDCPLRSQQTAINSDGSVALCCAVYDKKYDLAGSFLDQSHQTLQQQKYSHPFCQRCMAACGDLYYLYTGKEELDAIARRRLEPQTAAVS